MSKRMDRVIEYLSPSTGSRPGLWPALERMFWGYPLLAIFSLYPLVVILSLHLVYAVEWVANGQRPIPSHHVADNAVEAILYSLTGMLLVFAIPIFLIQLVGVGVVIISTEAGPKNFMEVCRILILVVLPLTFWGLLIATIVFDPTDAFGVFID